MDLQVGRVIFPNAVDEELRRMIWRMGRDTEQ